MTKPTARRMGNTPVLEPNLVFGGSCGDWVSVRPCGEKYEGKTYLGVLLGDLAQGIRLFVPKDEPDVEEAQFSFHNPAIYVPELKEVVMGNASWWGEIASEEDLKEITDADINNTWYVKALNDLNSTKENTDG